MVKKGNDVLNFQNFQNIFLQNCPFFSNITGLLCRISTSAQLDSKKNFSFERSRIIKNLHDKGL